MNEDHGLATLQLVEQRRKAPIAEIVAGVVGQDAGSVETEGIEGISAAASDFPADPSTTPVGEPSLSSGNARRLLPKVGAR
jgi:hypothetical protein